MTEVKERPKHRPSTKHTLDEVLRSLQDLVRNEFAESTPGIKQSHSVQGYLNTRYAAKDDSPPPHRRSRNRLQSTQSAAALNKDEILDSLRELIGTEFSDDAPGPGNGKSTASADMTQNPSLPKSNSDPNADSPIPASKAPKTSASASTTVQDAGPGHADSPVLPSGKGTNTRGQVNVSVSAPLTSKAGPESQSNRIGSSDPDVIRAEYPFAPVVHAAHSNLASAPSVDMPNGIISDAAATLPVEDDELAKKSTVDTRPDMSELSRNETHSQAIGEEDRNKPDQSLSGLSNRNPTTQTERWLISDLDDSSVLGQGIDKSGEAAAEPGAQLSLPDVPGASREGTGNDDDSAAPRQEADTHPDSPPPPARPDRDALGTTNATSQTAPTVPEPSNVHRMAAFGTRQLAIKIVAKLNMELRQCGERALSPKTIDRLQYLLRDELEQLENNIDSTDDQ